jgi:ATP-dependent helicase HrpB
MSTIYPVHALTDRLVAAVRAGARRLIIQAPTGSGKSTQIPQILLDKNLVSPDRRIVVLEPRRMAARLLARRVAQERGGSSGGEVGYQVRFEDRTGTRLNYVTEGILLRRFFGDPLLSDIGVVIFDEFHERHLYGDVSLACVRQLQETRPDLVLVVMSATLDGAGLEKYLNPCVRLQAEGRMFPVTVDYLERPVDFDRTPSWEVAAQETARWVDRHGEGDVLVFLPGAYEINRAVAKLRTLPEIRGIDVLPLHGELPAADQDAAVTPGPRRKIIVATNVAETSITIEGVRLVVDSGLARMARFDPYRGINTLLIERISRVSAEQRTGRAGRVGPGYCLRLWTPREDHDRPPREIPEIRRVDLAEIVLTLKAAGFADLKTLPWFDPPEERAMDRALLCLTDLGALDEAGAITDLGRCMAVFPVHPRFARMLIAARDYDCIRTVALIAALTQERTILVRADREAEERRERAAGDEERSDYFFLLKLLREAAARQFDLEFCRSLGVHGVTARRVVQLADYFCGIAGMRAADWERREPPVESVCKCILTGFADHVARRVDGGTLRCELTHGRKGRLERKGVVHSSPLLVAAEVREIEGRGGEVEVRLGLVTAVEPEWLDEMFPGQIKEEMAYELDSETRRVMGRMNRSFRGLVLASRRVHTVPEDVAATILAGELSKGRIELNQWDEAVEQWFVRVNCVAHWFPEMGIPPLGAEARRTALERLCQGAMSLREVRERPLWPAVKSLLTPVQQAQVERLAPERIALPGGHRVRVAYVENQPPTTAIKIQDLYDVRQTLCVGGGRIPLVIQILAPNQRPVQVTSDLPRFWTEHYPAIKRELQRKYPKHEWR